MELGGIGAHHEPGGELNVADSAAEKNFHSGKTALGVTPLVTQLIRRANNPVVVIDLKGDNALFQAVRYFPSAPRAAIRGINR